MKKIYYAPKAIIIEIDSEELMETIGGSKIWDTTSFSDGGEKQGYYDSQPYGGGSGLGYKSGCRTVSIWGED